MEILRIRHSWPEQAGFELSRPNGSGDFVLLHFYGSVDLFWNERGIVTQPGALMVFSPETGHGFRSYCPLLHDWMHISGDVAEQLRAFGLQPDTVYQLGCGHMITDMIARMESEFFARRPYWKEQSLQMLMQLFIAISRDFMGDNPAPVAGEMAAFLRELRAALLEHPEESWSTQAMAARIGISESRLYPLYKRMFAVSPGKDLILIRVEKAKNLLRQGETVEHTAEALGYGNVYNFIRQFKQITGMTPGMMKGGAVRNGI